MIQAVEKLNLNMEGEGGHGHNKPFRDDGE